MNWILEMGLVILIAIAAYIGGYFFGVYCESKKWKKMIPEDYGRIIIETSDPDGPYLFLDLDVSVDEIGTKDRVCFKIDTNGVTNNSRE